MKVKELIDILLSFDGTKDVLIKQDISSLKFGHFIHKNMTGVFQHPTVEKFICLITSDDEIDWEIQEIES